jgi:SAM-dependent methyltransferase
MIFWNAVTYMDDAIRSVLDQTHRSLELLLCDDGSTDASTALARDWARRDTRVRYVDHVGHAHRGTGASRNLGISAAQGEFVAFLDADDIWLPDHLARQVEMIRAHGEVGMVCGRALDWRSWNGSSGEEAWSPLPWPPGTLVAPPQMLTAVLRDGAYSTPVCSLLIRRRVLVELGGSEDDFTSMFEDQVLLARMYLTQTVMISGARTALYRQHEGSSTVAAIARGEYRPGGPSRSREAFLRWVLRQPQLTSPEADPELRSALQAALVPYDPQSARLRRRTFDLARAALPARLRRRIRWAMQRTPSPGRVRLGSLRRVAPVSRDFGYDRGLPVDRYYIEGFLAANADLIRGRVLEVGDAEYTEKFGGDRVSTSDVLNVAPGEPSTTFVGDLTDAPGLPSAAFDCVVLTQTLHLIYDMPAAVRTLRRILRPGGTLLLTVPGISQTSNDQWSRTWYWSLTPLAADRLFGEVFGSEYVEVSSHGNVLSCVAFLHGLAAHELRPAELDVRDGTYPLVVTVRAVRPRTDQEEP